MKSNGLALTLERRALANAIEELKRRLHITTQG